MGLKKEHTANLEFALKIDIFFFTDGYEIIVSSGRSYKTKKNSTEFG